MIKDQKERQVKWRIRIAYIALSLILLGWIMQAYSVLDWENAFALGIQQGTFEGTALERTIAEKERGEALADLIWPLPLTILAFVGLARRRFYGWLAAMMVFAICIYFPLFYLFQQLGGDLQIALLAIFLWAVPSIAAIFTLWSIRKQFFSS